MTDDHPTITGGSHSEAGAGPAPTVGPDTQSGASSANTGPPAETAHVLADRLTPRQWGWLLAPINPGRVQTRDGHHNLEQWDVRRWLDRIFGLAGWDCQTLELTCVQERIEDDGANERGTKKYRHWVSYRAQVRLIVRDRHGRILARYDDASVQSSANQPEHARAHDQAAKSALSGALKRAAVNLGDQFGLALYSKDPAVLNLRDGTSLPVVGRVAVLPTAPAPDPTPTGPAEAVTSTEDDDIQPEAASAAPVSTSSPAERPPASTIEIDPAQRAADIDRMFTAAEQAGLDGDTEKINKLWKWAQDHGWMPVVLPGGATVLDMLKHWAAVCAENEKSPPSRAGAGFDQWAGVGPATTEGGTP